MAFLRTSDFDDHTVVARSHRRGGKSFGPWEDAGFQGHPHCATLLPDGRILLVYGYRHKPFGIRARVLDAEATNFKESKEIVLRDDGGSGDLGYPWVSAMADGRYLVVYYFNRDDGTRHIAGTVLSPGKRGVSPQISEVPFSWPRFAPCRVAQSPRSNGQEDNGCWLRH